MTDMTGRICLVTGATRGIGRATAEALAKSGAHVLLHGRDSASVGAVCREMIRYGQVTGVVGDLSSLAAVRKLATEIAAQYPRLDVLVNNAGTGARRRQVTVDGYERTFAINHLAPFLLTNLLLDKLKAGKAARVVTVSSMAHRGSKLDFDDLNWEKRKFKGLGAYGASKLANILFTVELANRLAGSGVTANCLHPGVVATNIFTAFGGRTGKIFTVLLRPFMLSPADGAKTSIYLASSPEVGNVTGKFFDKCREVAPTAAGQDAAAAKRLWDVSAKLTRLSG
ncbi:MAG TPA: SDR family oxidoreductase [Gammaproteobacteria bacterium]|nr:SDR family oxidoreductase [Gammaproteobacteria bacterium]